MILTLISSVLALLASIVAIAWYNLKYKPQQYANLLVSQGATIPTWTNFIQDDTSGLKKAMETNPNMKAAVLKFPGGVFLFIIDTQLIKEVLSNHHYYSKLNSSLELSRIFNSRGVTVAEGQSWKLHRKVLSEAFQYDLFNDMIPTIMEATNEVINNTSDQKKKIYLPTDIELITSEAVTRLFFGLKSRDVMINKVRASEEASAILKQRRRYDQSLIRFVFGTWVFNLSSNYRNLKKRMRAFRQVFGEKIHERMEEIKATSSQPATTKRRDFLQILLQQRLQHKDDPSQTLSDEEILDEFSVFFLAGKDTTSILVSMALYCFVKNPEWGKRILTEINERTNGTSQFNLDLLNSMNDLSAFINEVLRYYPPAPRILPRKANRDHYLGDLFIKKGCAVNTLFIANHFNPKYFDDPEKFDPSRWLKTENQARNEGWKNDSFAYLPFSAGPRNCIGKHLALMEAKIILVIILKNFEVEIESGYELQIGSIGIGFGPKDLIPLILTPK